jgi:hypothetical protein
LKFIWYNPISIEIEFTENGHHNMRKLKIIALVIAISCGSLFAVSTKSTTMGSVNPALANPSGSGTVYLPLIHTSGNPKEPRIFGIESKDVVGTDLDRLNEVGTYWIRRNGLLWSEVQPDEFGGYNWSTMSNLEQEMINASSNGMEMILVVRSTPTWAQKITGVFCGPIKSSKFDEFGDFMYEAVMKYKEPPYNVKYWQIWNEPDADPEYIADPGPWWPFGCWGDEDAADYGGGYYADMLEVVYPRIKQADDEAQVVLGGLLLSCPPDAPDPCHLQSKFLEGVLNHNGDNDGKNYFDITAIHAYDYYTGFLGGFGNSAWNSWWNDEGPVAIKKARFIRSVLGDYGASNKEIMVTENALICTGASCDPNDPVFDPDFVTTKTYYIAKVYAASIYEGFPATIWYDLSTNWANTSLLKNDLTYTDAFWAFQTAKNSLRDSDSFGKISESGVAGYKFDRGDRIIWLVWSLDGSTHTFSLPSEPIAAWDVLNNPVPVTGSTMQVGMEPIYLEWLP